MDKNYTQLNEKIELAREHQDYPTALSAAGMVLIEAIEEEDYTQAINAIGHKLLIYKDLWFKTQKPEFNQLMLSEVTYGLELCERQKINGQPKAIMLHRASDYYFQKEDYAMAARLSEKACEELPQKNTGEYAELLNHRTAAQVLSGTESAFSNFDIAYQIAETDSNLRDFHKKAILSGILLRKAFVQIKLGKKPEAEAIITQATPICESLATEYNMEVRKNQLETLKKLIS